MANSPVTKNQNPVIADELDTKEVSPATFGGDAYDDDNLSEEELRVLRGDTPRDSDEDDDDEQDLPPSKKPDDDETTKTPDDEGDADRSRASEPDSESDKSAESDDGDNDHSDDVNRIPQSRLNKEIEKRKTLEKEVEELRKWREEEQQKVEAERQHLTAEEEKRKVEEADKALMESLTEAFEKGLDGDTAEAAKAIFEAIKADRQNIQEVAARTSKETYRHETTQERTVRELQAKADELTGKYPQFDDKNESFDQQALVDALDLRDYYIEKKGMAPAEALEKAVVRTAKENGYSPANAEPEQQAEEQTREREKRQKLDEKLQSASRQPPRLDGENDKERSKPRIEELTEEQFDALSDEELKRMRGDFS